MDALDIKLLRDFRRLWAQAVAIALVLACGVAILMTTFGMYRALEETRDTYYERNRFADLFASARRAPRALMPEILALQGVYAAEARVTGEAILDLPGRDETAVGRILSLPAAGEPILNLPLLRAGRLPDPDRPDEVIVNEPFAEANGFRPGDTFWANLDGRRRGLTITGTFLSPEFIYTIPPGGMMPDNAGFGVIYMPETAAAAAFDMEGAFNSLSLKLTAGARPEAVAERLDLLLEPYGGTGAHGRDRQESHSFVDAELTQLRSMSMILPPIFFGITAFLVNMVIGRIVFLERPEIGLLKAIGYSSHAVAVHYLMLSGLVAVVGIAVGWGLGTWLSHAMARLFAQFFDFPYLVFRMGIESFAISGLLAMASAGLGAAQGALRAARLAPAVAMLPPAPPHFRRGLMDRAFHALRLSQPMMMILRSLLRWPLRTALSALGVAFAAAILVASSFMMDSMDELLDVAFNQSTRQDATLVLPREAPLSAIEDARRLPGVILAEPQAAALATLRNGPREKRVPIEARPPGADLSRLLDADGRAIDPPAGGILLDERLAEQLGARQGELIEVEFLTGRHETLMVPVAGTVTQYMGLAAFMEMATLDALRRQSPRLSAINVTIDPAHLAEFHAALKETPALSSTVMLTEVRRSFDETLNQSVGYMTTIYITIAVLITVGIAYNSARIQLSERARELASLRILGFTRAEVSFVLVGETMLVALLAQPLGWLLGLGIVWAAVEGFETDLYRIPLVVRADTFATASLVVLASALGAALMVRRRLDSLDLVAVMKTRE